MTKILEREEYVEQAHFFRVYRERMDEDVPTQDILSSVREEILATAKLAMAIEFLKGEILHRGEMHQGMARLEHYFTPFQTFVMERAEADKSKFDQRIALEVLQRLAEYLSKSPAPAGLFIYQFESIARNRLGYDVGMTAMAADPFYGDDWREWILHSRLKLGGTDFTDMLYYRSEHYVEEQRRRTCEQEYQASYPILFGVQEGRIAQANRGKDPLYMFAALQRHLGYPKVPRQKVKSNQPDIHPALEMRLHRIEQRIKLLEQEMKGGIDLNEFMKQEPNFTDLDNPTVS